LVVIIVSCISGTCFSANTLPDSLLSIDKVYSYCYQSPDTAFAILHTLRERGMEPTWKLNMVAGDLNRRHNHYHAAIDYYEKALESKEISNDCNIQAEVWKGLMNCHDMLMDDLLLTDDLYHLWKCGNDCNNEYYKALSRFITGKRLHLHGKKNQGYNLCQEAISVLKNDDTTKSLQSLRICYGVLVKLYRNDRLFDKALEMSKLQEQMVRKHGPDDIPGEREINLHNVYAQRASLLAESGRQKEADSAYEQWVKTKPGSPYDEREVLSYLMLTNKLEEALFAVRRYKSFLNSEGDSVNIRMLDALTYESHIYSLMDDYKQAAQNYGPMASIAYQLHQLTSQKEMQARYQSLQERDRLHSRNMWLLAILLTLAGAALVVGIYVMLYKRVLQKNIDIQRAFGRILAYQRDAIRSEKSYEVQPPFVSESEPDTAQASKGTVQKPLILEKTEEPEDEDEALFVKLDKLVTRDQMFLLPELTREDLMRLIGVDKNRFGRIMKRYSGASNVAVYINQKRAHYAANYIKNHPEYTIAAAMSSCGMTNSVTLNRAFKDLYGMTPSEYRKQVVGNPAGGVAT